MNKLKCNQCKHEWLPRVETPVSCPKCKRPDWDKPKVINRGKKK